MFKVELGLIRFGEVWLYEHGHSKIKTQKTHKRTWTLKITKSQKNTEYFSHKKTISANFEPPKNSYLQTLGIFLNDVRKI